MWSNINIASSIVSVSLRKKGKCPADFSWLCENKQDGDWPPESPRALLCTALTPKNKRVKLRTILYKATLHNNPFNEWSATMLKLKASTLKNVSLWVYMYHQIGKGLNLCAWWALFYFKSREYLAINQTYAGNLQKNYEVNILNLLTCIQPGRSSESFFLHHWRPWWQTTPLLERVHWRLWVSPWILQKTQKEC